MYWWRLWTGTETATAKPLFTTPIGSATVKAMTHVTAPEYHVNRGTHVPSEENKRRAEE